MKKILFSILLLLITTIAYAAQTTVNTPSDTFGVAWDRQQGMNTEIYDYMLSPCVFKDSPGQYNIFIESFENLDNWTQGGTVSVSNGVVSISSPDWSSIGLDFTQKSKYFTPPIDHAFIVEFTGTTSADSTTYLMLNGLNASIFKVMIWTPDGGYISGEAAGDTEFTNSAFPELDSTQKYNLKVLVDPINKIIQIYIKYQNLTTNHVEISEACTQHVFTYDPDDANYFKNIQINHE